jgi:hypothetical protein
MSAIARPTLAFAAVESRPPFVPPLAGPAGPSFALHVVRPLSEPTPNVVERRIAPGG